MVECALKIDDNRQSEFSAADQGPAMTGENTINELVALDVDLVMSVLSFIESPFFTMVANDTVASNTTDVDLSATMKFSQRVLAMLLCTSSDTVEHSTQQSSDRGRKRCRNEKQWKRNVCKRLKNSGSSYISISGKVMGEKQIGSGCGPKCRYKCHSVFDGEMCRDIFSKFWTSGNLNQQQQYLADHVQRSPTACKTTAKENSARKFSYSYYLDLGESKVAVCKIFFLETLGIKENIVYGACHKKSSSGVVDVDKRGTHGKQRLVSDRIKSDIKEHI